MRKYIPRATALGFALAGLLAAPRATAQSFPADNVWTPLTRGGAAVTDPVGDGVNERDIVGDATNPAVFLYQDADFLYFRVRVDKDPLKPDATFAPFGWGCAVESDGLLTTYEFLAVVNGIINSGPDGQPDEVEWRWNSVTTKPDAVDELAETLVQAFPRVTHARGVAAASNFGGDGDFFVDWAIPVATIRVGGNGAPGIPAGTTYRIACGTSNNAQSYGADPASPDPNASATLTSTWSDPFACGAAGCVASVACDGAFGGGTAAACPLDAAPVCQTAGACVACTGDFSSAQADKCQRAGAPACNLAAPLLGQCTQCSVTNQAACAGATPACDLASGSCSTCNGDRGSAGATRACSTNTAPTCNIGAGTCGTCTTDADCVGAGHTGPTCDVATGACTDLDTDGDGVNDATELLLGTDKTKKDSDGDGIDDKTELTPTGGTATAKVDTDGDGIIDALDTDSDGDGVLDSAEGTTDLDGDGVANYRDKDDDGDGILTRDEISDAKSAGVSDDVDMDGKPNYDDTDADGDGKPDAVEGRGDDDGDKIPNYLDNDGKLPGDAGTDASTGTDAGTSGGPDSGHGDGGGNGITPPDDGVVEGGGISCAINPGPASSTVLGVLFAIALGAVMRRRRRD